MENPYCSCRQTRDRSAVAYMRRHLGQLVELLLARGGRWRGQRIPLVRSGAGNASPASPTAVAAGAAWPNHVLAHSCSRGYP